MKLHRALLSCAAAAGGVLAVVLLPAGVAIADGTWVLTPDIDTFAATQADGFPPLFEHATGTELVDVKDVTLSADFGKPEFNDTHTVFGSFTNDDFAVQSGISFAVGSDSLHLPAGTEIDVANFGDGFINQWIDVPGVGVGAGITDLFITPFGDFNIPL